MKDREHKVGFRFGVMYPMILPLRKATDKYSPYDFECDKYIIEVKCRDKCYDDWLIEKIKVDTNIKIGEETKRDFLYITEYKGKGFVWNISKLIKGKYNFNWEKKNLPQTTEFSKKKWILKEVGYLKQKDSTKVRFFND